MKEKMIMRVTPLSRKDTPIAYTEITFQAAPGQPALLEKNAMTNPSKKHSSYHAKSATLLLQAKRSLQSHTQGL